MDLNKVYFVDFLLGKGTKNVIFEPFITRAHTETLIWRRGEHLWKSPATTLDTLISLTERTGSDIAFVDVRGRDIEYTEELIDAMKTQNTSVGLGLICDSRETITLAENSSVVDCLCLYGDTTSRHLPVIRMDGKLSDAIQRGDAGYFAKTDAERLIHESSNDSIRILGGLGVDRIVDGAPVYIYETVRKTATIMDAKWACGSGGVIPDTNYLELISLLGAFGNIR